jgi:TPR repeat protein
MFEHGRSVPADPVSAWMWYSLAAAQGHDPAKERVQLIAHRMTESQLSEAAQLLHERLTSNDDRPGRMASVKESSH